MILIMKILAENIKILFICENVSAEYIDLLD